MAEPRGSRRWLAVAAVAAVVVGWAATHGGNGGNGANGGNGGASGPRNTTAAASAAPAPTTPGNSPAPTWTANQDPARYAPQVRTYARAAGIDPQLLMAILYNESYKPHDPSWERAWQRLKPDAAFGIANMHRAAFDEAKQGRDFADRSWEQLPDDPALAIEAAAWYLHDLARQLPVERSSSYTTDELLALGYNAGAGNMRAFARGARPGAAAQSYLDRLHANWSTAGRAVASAGR